MNIWNQGGAPRAYAAAGPQPALSPPAASRAAGERPRRFGAAHVAAHVAAAFATRCRRDRGRVTDAFRTAPVGC